MTRLLRALGRLRLSDWLSLAAILLSCAYMIVTTDWFVRPVGTNPITIRGRDYTFVRQMPYGTMDGETWSEITMPDGQECDSGDWRPNTYQVAPGDTITQQLGEWAWPCVDQGPPFYIRTLRRVLLFGVPLRPLETETNIRAPGPSLPLPLPPGLALPSD